MNVLSRNYFRMLRNGAFGDKEPMEPMSKYKWDLLYKRAEEEEVLSYLKDDVPHASINFENHKQTRRFKKIAKAEYHAIDTSLDTLDMLNILLYNIDRTLSGKTSIHGIVEMGRFLRRKGDKVDFVKLESWLHQLRIYNMARLHASVLIVKPCGTGSPSEAISARLAPLPPSNSRMLALPSVLPQPKK